ncbi:MAG: S9 family peptidase [Alphaproteobacteria bacterium]|nr:S9 family peptidase [Alphaproteobacteria bacterium]
MTPFLPKARQQVACALILTISSFLVTSKANADALDDAMRAARSAPEAVLVKRQDLLKRGYLDAVRLSPNGDHIAYSLNEGRANRLGLYDVKSKTHRALFTSKMVDQIFWSFDSRYLFLESAQGVAVASLEAPDLPSFLINLDNDKDEHFYRVDPTHPHALIVSKQVKDGGTHTFYRVQPDGEKTALFTSTHYVADVLPGGQARPTFVLRLNDEMLELVRLENGTETRLMTCEADDRCHMVAYHAASDSLIMRGALEGDLSGVHKVNAKTGAHVQLHADPENRFDIAWTILNPHTGLPTAAGYKTDHTAFYALGEQTKAILQEIDKHGSGNYQILRANRDLTKWLVFGADTKVPDVRLFDTTSGKTSHPFSHFESEIISENKETYEALRAPRVPIWYIVSDGMKQQGYVTLPLGKDPATVPLVVAPHGGPWGRDDGAFDTEAQFLANRGYAVFQPNFRASTGFGKNYTVSADRDFGNGRVQQDIIDGLEYVLARGIGDRSKLAIFGHSFGGFSALGGVSFTPDLFQVGIAGAPPVDLSKSVKYFSDMDRSPEFKYRLANFKKLTVDLDDPMDVKRIRDKSPDAHWQKISKPLYIWAGKKDPKVSVLNVRDYALRLDGAGKTITYLEEPRAGHSPHSDIGREAYFYMVEKALADHVGGRLETGVSEPLRRHLKRITTIDRNTLLAPAAD